MRGKCAQVRGFLGNNLFCALFMYIYGKSAQTGKNNSESRANTGFHSCAPSYASARKMPDLKSARKVRTGARDYWLRFKKAFDTDVIEMMPIGKSFDTAINERLKTLNQVSNPILTHFKIQEVD